MNQMSSLSFQQTKNSIPGFCSSIMMLSVVNIIYSFLNSCYYIYNLTKILNSACYSFNVYLNTVIRVKYFVSPHNKLVRVNILT